ncbi:hypothetical protein L596_009507 [Steinernema carpocapsae]|nr:hypothetical protein L596_009507 [Steinernema carpocapsae]
MTSPYAAKPHSDEMKWVCFYPNFINKKCKAVEGRRVNLDIAIENPTPQEIFDILSHAGLKCRLEKKKTHPRDPNREPHFQGRVRVQLKNDDGSPCNEKFTNRQSLMKYACEMIPMLKTRQGGSSNSQPAASGKKKKR